MEKNTQLEQLFSEQVGVSINQLVGPLSEDKQPCGKHLKLTAVYSTIQEARKADDTSTPKREWEHKNKVSNWEEVTHVAVESLLHETKDLQIAIWLVEAQLNKHGFVAIAPGFHFLHRLAHTFWEDIHPVIVDPVHDLSFRTNLIAWLNSKLDPAIKQLPITQTRQGQSYTWEDWERAALFESLSQKNQEESLGDFVPMSTLVSAVVSTPIGFYQSLFRALQNALAAIDAFSHFLDSKMGEQATSLNNLKDLLKTLYETIHNHVKLRMADAAPVDSAGDDPTENTLKDAHETGQQPGIANSHNTASSSGSSLGATRNREEAYARLAEAADYLCMDDPHSPVPYLVYKAIEWGQLNTAELYQELFVQYQGQLNIFEILGLDIGQQQKR